MHARHPHLLTGPTAWSCDQTSAVLLAAPLWPAAVFNVCERPKEGMKTCKFAGVYLSSWSILCPAELQTARCLHRYPASSAQHRQRLLAPGVRLWMYQFGDAEWDWPDAGKPLSCCINLIILSPISFSNWARCLEKWFTLDKATSLTLNTFI